MTETLYYKSPVGGLILKADSALFELKPGTSSAPEKTDNQILNMCKHWLDIYFSGREPDFAPPVRLDVPGFAQRVLSELKNVSYGSVISYSELARRLGNKNAARAVGRALSLNPVFIIVPCHRVIAAHGIGGYAGGIKMKSELLRLEQK